MNESVDDIKKRVMCAQKNYAQNQKIIDDILLNERGYVSKTPSHENVVAICSGGLDSSVMLQMLIEEWDVTVHPLFFRRGARAEKFEEQAFDFFTGFYKKRFPDNIGEIAKLDYKIPPEDFKKHFQKELALTTGHPLRNSTMQNLAVMYAVALNGRLGLDIKTVFTGSVAEDNTEPELGLLSLRAQTLNTCINLADWGWQITAPLIDPYLMEKPVNKVDLIAYALYADIPLEKTRTCFGADEKADGTCFACQKRLRAFKHLRIKDPLEYQNQG